MRILEITANAYQELDEIEEYTEKVWGPAQAERYLNALYAGIDRVMANPGLLLKQDDRISEHLYFYRIEKHFIFCDVSDEHLIVLSIQHAARDLPTRIAELESSLSEEVEILHQERRQAAAIRASKAGDSG